MKRSQASRHRTLLVFAGMLLGGLMAASPASAVPMQINDPTGQFDGSYIYYDMNPLTQTGTIGICAKAGPNPGWFFGTNEGGAPSGNIAPPEPAPVADCKTGTPVIAATGDGGDNPDTIFDPTGLLLSDGDDLGFIHFYFNPDAQKGEIGICGKNPQGPVTGYVHLTGPTDQAGPGPDACPQLQGGGGPPDADGDTVPDATDNCPAVANTDQANNDGDTQGDACDDDDDNDTVLDTSDTCPTTAGPASNNGCPVASTPRPNTKIKGPGRTRDRTPTFRLISTVSGSTFICKIDKQDYRRCDRSFSPRRNQAYGKHTLKAKAVKNGKVDKTPAAHRFEVRK